jgi:phage-related protein
MRQRVHELGGVMSDEAVKASAAYQDSLQDMQTSIGGLKRGIVSDFLPSITGVMDGLTEIFSGNSDEGLGMVKDGISDFIGKIQEGIPRLIEIGGSILTALYEAIMENLPQIVEGGTELIIKLVEGLISALPQLIPAVITLVGTIVRTLWEHMPEIIQAGRDAVSSLTGGMDAGQLAQKGLELLARLLATIAAKAPELLQKGIELVGQLAAGLIRAIPKVVAAIPQIISRIRTAFGQFDWASLGFNIIAGIARGIAGAASAIGDALMGAVKSAWSTVTGWLGIHSPSKRAEKEVGVNWAEGYGVGFVRQMPKVGQEMLSAVSDTFDALNGATGVGLGSGSAGGGGTFAPVINIYGAEGQDVRALADIVMNRMAVEYRRGKGSYATA